MEGQQIERNILASELLRQDVVPNFDPSKTIPVAYDQKYLTDSTLDCWAGWVLNLGQATGIQETPMKK
jgi:hypothetical protein